jgi:DoxX
VSTTLERPLGVAQAPATGVQVRDRAWGDSRFQAFTLMRLGYTVLPIAMGIDKFFNAMVSWPQYLAGWINDIAPGTGQQFMYFVGAVEILAGLIVLLKPRYGAYVVAAWLAGIVINLFSTGNWWDVGVRDFGLMLGALALGRLAAYYDAPLFSRSRS